MVQIIRGKVYNTNTAKELGWYFYGRSYRDLDYVEEKLYRKRTGEFFLYGSGGPVSKYAVSAGQNSWSGGSRIIPLSTQEARDWAGKNLSVQDFEAIFGPTSESGTSTLLEVQISSALAEQLVAGAEREGKPLDTYVEQLLLAAMIP